MRAVRLRIEQLAGSSWPIEWQLGLARRYATSPCLRKVLPVLFTARCANVIWLRNHHHYSEIVSTLRHTLTRRMGREKWWALFRLGVESLQDARLAEETPFEQHADRLEVLFKYAPKPMCGRDAAYCFVSFALLYHSAGKLAKALDYIACAKEADENWGYPSYLSGRMLLQSGDPDTAASEFQDAVQHDWRYLRRLSLDPLSDRYPAVLKAVRRVVRIK